MIRLDKLRLSKTKDDAVSPVVGTILMVAVTVILGIAVYAAMSGFGEDSAEASPDYGFKVTTVDTDDNGMRESIKVTYISGPTGVDDGAITLQTDTGCADGVDLRGGTGNTWDPGDFATYGPGCTGSVSATLTVGNEVVVDTVLSLDESS